MSIFLRRWGWSQRDPQCRIFSSSWHGQVASRSWLSSVPKAPSALDMPGSSRNAGLLDGFRFHTGQIATKAPWRSTPSIFIKRIPTCTLRATNWGRLGGKVFTAAGMSAKSSGLCIPHKLSYKEPPLHIGYPIFQGEKVNVGPRDFLRGLLSQELQGGVSPWHKGHSRPRDGGEHSGDCACEAPDMEKEDGNSGNTTLKEAFQTRPTGVLGRRLRCCVRDAVLMYSEQRGRCGYALCSATCVRSFEAMKQQ